MTKKNRNRMQNFHISKMGKKESQKYDSNILKEKKQKKKHGESSINKITA